MSVSDDLMMTCSGSVDPMATEAGGGRADLGGVTSENHIEEELGTYQTGVSSRPKTGPRRLLEVVGSRLRSPRLLRG
jgi:hypothetical protein